MLRYLDMEAYQGAALEKLRRKEPRLRTVCMRPSTRSFSTPPLSSTLSVNGLKSSVDRRMSCEKAKYFHNTNVVKR